MHILFEREIEEKWDIFLSTSSLLKDPVIVTAKAGWIQEPAVQASHIISKDTWLTVFLRRNLLGNWVRWRTKTQTQTIWIVMWTLSIIALTTAPNAALKTLLSS